MLDEWTGRFLCNGTGQLTVDTPGRVVTFEILVGTPSVAVVTSHALLDAAEGGAVMYVTDVTNWTDVTTGATSEEKTVLETATLMMTITATRKNLEIAIADVLAVEEVNE